MLALKLEVVGGGGRVHTVSFVAAVWFLQQFMCSSRREGVEVRKQIKRLLVLALSQLYKCTSCAPAGSLFGRGTFCY